MVLQEQAQHLIDTDAPISASKTSTRSQFVIRRAKGLDNYQIATELHLPLDIIDEIECDLEDEFLS